MQANNKHIRVFALSTCPHCRRLKKFLDKNGINYEVIDIDTLDSGQQWVMTKELKKYNPGATYPTIIIEEIIIGFDEHALKDSLSLS